MKTKKQTTNNSNRLFNSRKAQLSIVNILFFLILIIVMAVVSPIADEAITSTDYYSNSSGVNRLLMDSIVPFMWLALIIVLFMYVSPQSPNFRQFG